MKTHILLFTILAGCLVASAATVPPGGNEEDMLKPPTEGSPFDNRQKPDANSLIFAKYYKWKRITPKLESAAGGEGSICCPPKGTNAGQVTEPYFNVFSDKNAELAFARPAGTPFPEGSMIVKELLSSNKKGTEARTLLAMVKRDEGFDPAHGDWEFMVLRRIKQPIIVERGKIAHCQNCHEKAKAQDFVFRGYAMGKR